MESLVNLPTGSSPVTDADEEVHTLQYFLLVTTLDADMTQDLLALLGAQPDQRESCWPGWLPRTRPPRFTERYPIYPV